MRPTAFLVVTMLALLLPGGATAATYEHTVYLHEYSGGLHIVPEEIRAGVGDTIVLSVLNQGASSHNLRVCGDSPPSPTSECQESWGQTKFSIAPNETSLLTVELTKAGTFEYYCYIPGHKSGGMVGGLIVQGDAEEKSTVPGLGVGALAIGLALVALARRSR